MFEIRGKYATAQCYAVAIDDKSVGQIMEMLNQPFAEGQRVAIMPDAHAGAGCVIGTTMTIGDKVCPNLVGVDIGCGMLCAEVDMGDLSGMRPYDMEALDAACHAIPSGFSVWDRPQGAFDLRELRCANELQDTGRLERSLGTLGGGNHFIELDVDGDGRTYLVIHSGSRNLGLQVAKLYQARAVRERRAHTADEAELVRRYKAQGREREIEGALAELRRKHDPARHTPDALCWLEGRSLADYLHDMEVCQRFAARSRELMVKKICDRLGLTVKEQFHTVHNYIDTDEAILRKGAVAAHEGEPLLIPLNMRDGAVLARGCGRADWNFSAPHGAGRTMSRAKAKENLSLDEYRRQMEAAGIYTTSVKASTLDEAPDAYKRADDILGPIAEAVDVVSRLRPVYNFKAS